MSRFVDENYVDSRANGYALKCFCITMAAFSLAWLLNQLNIFIVDKMTMTIGWVLSLVLFVICLAICKLVGLNKSGMKYVLMLFIIAITTVIEVELTYHAVILSVIPIVYSSMYSDIKRMTLFTYLMTIISLIVIVFVGYNIGLCDANMALLTAEPLAKYVGADGAFNLTTINPDPVITLSLYFVFPRIVMCGVFVPICINISNIIAASRMRAEEMRMLAEIDGMTGLYNKSKYLELVSDTYIKEEKIGVIFWDINDLKLINDTYGHETGDKLIMMVSDSIKALSSQTAKAYRIGGDEFVMIIRGADKDEVESKVNVWKKNIEGKMIDGHIPVSSAVGYSYGAGMDLEDIINRADNDMYTSKREYHKKENNL